MEKATIWTIGMVMALGLGVGAIPVYDCQDEGTTYIAIDLREAEACPDPDEDFEEPRTAMMHLLQRDSELPVIGHQCHITETQQVTRCGFNSLTYGSAYSTFEKQVELTPQECRRVVQTGRMRIGGRAYNVTPGNLVMDRFFSHGHVDRNGNCRTESFLSGGQWYDRSYEETFRKILVKKIRGTHDTAMGT